MARKKSVKVAEKATAVNAPAVEPRPVGVRFDRVITQLLQFEELTLPDGVLPTPAPGGRTSVQLRLKVAISTPDDGAFDSALVFFDSEIFPDPAHQPYKIRVVLGGVFSHVELPQEEFLDFCRRSGPTIMFPYLRAAVSGLTADAQFGPVRIDPVNLTGATITE